LKKGLLLVWLVLVGTASHAQENSYVYVGLGAGAFDHAILVPNQGFEFTISDRTTATKLYGGWRVNDNMALEASYGESGELHWADSIIVLNADGVFGPDLNVMLDAVTRAEWTTSTVSVLGYVGRVFGGFGWYNVDGSFSWDAVCSCGPGDYEIARDSTESDVFFTVGAEWDFEWWAVRGQYEHYDTQGKAQSALYMGVSLRF
jgi:hypothetical protein